MTGDEWTIKSLAPGASKTFKASYKVTEDDVDAGEVVNIAAITGSIPGSDTPLMVESDPAKATTIETETSSTLTVKTGDNNMFILYLGLVIAAAGAVVVAGGYRQRKTRR